MDTNEIIRPRELLYLSEGSEETHRDPSEEIKFYRAVAAGAIRLVQDNCSRGVFENPDGMGCLSKDPIQNLKYHFVVTVAMITRFCVEGGMPMEEAFRLSDSYILEMDRKQTIADIVLLHDRMALDFTGRMRNRKKQAAKSTQVREAIDYIYDHVREHITVEDLAKAICISPTYLSRIFKKELGVSVSEYIRLRKIDLAKNMLRFSDWELADIACALSYSSQSHFIQHFRSQVGMTPKVYREKYHGDNFGVNRESDADISTEPAESPSAP